MADRRYNNSRGGSGGDIYGEMFDRELEKNQRMADRGRTAEKPDFNAGDERRRQNYHREGSSGRHHSSGQQSRQQTYGEVSRPDFRMDNGGVRGYDSGSSEHRSSRREQQETHRQSDRGYNGSSGSSRQGREYESRSQSSYSYSGSGYDESPLIGRGEQDHQDYRPQSAYSYTGGGSSRSGRGDEDYRPQSNYSYAGGGSSRSGWDEEDYRPQSNYSYAGGGSSRSVPGGEDYRPQNYYYSDNSGAHNDRERASSEHHHHSSSHSHSHSSGHRRVKSSAERYAEDAGHKHSDKQLAFGRFDQEGEKLNEVKTFSFGSFLKILFVLIVIVVLLVQLLIVRYISMVNTVSTGSRAVTAAELSDAKVTNVLIIGSDNRGADDSDHSGRTDSMIIASINSRSKELTLTSVMRDSYVEIPGRGWGKLNSAYAYGGAELVLDTIQMNFGIKLDKYVFVDFFSFITIIDAAGGINLDITDEEAQGMEPPLAEQNKYLKYEKGTDYLTSGGQDMKVNGNQALAYARLRYVGNADFERTDRQRIVINKLLEKAKTLSLLELDNFLKISCRELTTNMSGSEMYVFFYKLLFSLRYTQGELRLPPDGTFTYGDHDGLSTLDLDFDACKRVLKEYVYK